MSLFGSYKQHLDLFTGPCPRIFPIEKRKISQVLRHYKPGKCSIFLTQFPSLLEIFIPNHLRDFPTHTHTRQKFLTFEETIYKTFVRDNLIVLNVFNTTDFGLGNHTRSYDTKSWERFSENTFRLKSFRRDHLLPLYGVRVRRKGVLR